VHPAAFRKIGSCNPHCFSGKTLCSDSRIHQGRGLGPKKMNTKLKLHSALLALALPQLAWPIVTATPESAPLILAAKFVEYTDPSSGNPVLSFEQAATLVIGLNKIYDQCGIKIKLDQYQALDPSTQDLPYNLSSMPELDPIRKRFDDPHEIVVVNTGPWNHRTIGSANAWTAMPGDQPAGAVIESTVATDAPVVAHELGHYLGLDHLKQASNEMNPIIYGDSTKFETWQCESMKKTAELARAGAIRATID
jgi:hypothetical protein